MMTLMFGVSWLIIYGLTTKFTLSFPSKPVVYDLKAETTLDSDGDWKTTPKTDPESKATKSRQYYPLTSKNRTLTRVKRWEDYDSNYDWENQENDYDVADKSKRKETKLEKWAKSWQKHALRFIFIFSFIMMIVCCCCAACKKFVSKLCSIICMHLREWRDLCLNRDPMYRMMRKQADEYGIELDYEEFKRIKNAYEQSLKKHGYSNVDLSGR